MDISLRQTTFLQDNPFRLLAIWIQPIARSLLKIRLSECRKYFGVRPPRVVIIEFYHNSGEWLIDSAINLLSMMLQR